MTDDGALRTRCCDPTGVGIPMMASEMPSAFEPPRVVELADGVIVGEVDNVCVVVWRGPVNRARFEAQRAGLRQVVQRHPEGAGFLCVVETTSKPPDEELRRESAAMIQEHLTSLKGIACVVEGTGFVNAVARSVLAAMAQLLGPRKVPLTVVGTVDSATAWMAPRVGASSAADLARGAETIRVALATTGSGAR